MPTPQLQSPKRATEIFETLIKSWKILVVPIVLCTLVAGWYSLKPKTWLASQSLVVRDDMIGDSFKPGRFESLDSMKTAQETILHIAREPAVVQSALEKIGPPSGKSDNWLEGEAGIEIVEDTRDAISIVAPNGAEFGKTEVIVLQAKAKSRDRAGKLVTALLDEIETNLRNVRTRRLASMESELSESLKLAEEDYRQFVDELQKVEREVGSDLPTLLNMISEGSTSNDIQVALENLRGAKRKTQAQLDTTNKQLDSLNSTVDSPEELVATSNELLEAQPALRRLKDGLIDAELKLAEDMGRFEEAHPGISKARFAVSEIKLQIRRELLIAIRGLEGQRDVRRQQMDRLLNEEKSFKERLLKLTNNRARYATLASQSKKRNEENANTRAKYFEIKSLGQAAQSVNLMTRLDEPFVSSRPIGPGRTSIVGSGLIGGVLIGLGLVMFFSAPGSPSIIEPPSSGPNGNMTRPINPPVQPAPVPDRTPNPSTSNPRTKPRPVQVVKQLGDKPPAPAAPSAPGTAPTMPFPAKGTQSTSSQSQVPPQTQAPVTPVGQLASSVPDRNVPPVAFSSANKLPGAAENVKPASKPTIPATSPVPQARPITKKSELGKLEGDASAEVPAVQLGNLQSRQDQDTVPRAKKNPPPKRTQVETGPGSATPTTRMPSQETTTPEKTIDLNTLRHELGSKPLESSSNPPSLYDLNDVKNQLMESASKTVEVPDPSAEASESGSLHDRIKRLTDPTQILKKQIKPKDLS